jgi:glyoxalase-like protein
VTRVNPYFAPAAFATFILAFSPIGAAELKIDHVTVAGAKLESMRQAFTAATGLATEYGGRHANHATEMALTSFPDGSYLELIGIQGRADQAAVSAHEWHRFLENSTGPCAFAIRAGALAGIARGAPQRNGRTRPDGTRLEWEITDIGPGIRGTFFPFLIRDLTPRENRAFLKGQPTTRKALGVARVVVGVRDLHAAIALYRRVFQLSAPKGQHDAEFGAELAWFEGTPFVLAQGLANDSWLARRVREFGEGPCAFVLQSAGGLSGASGSHWFGSAIVWTNEQRLGWRLGLQAGR